MNLTTSPYISYKDYCRSYMTPETSDERYVSSDYEQNSYYRRDNLCQPVVIVDNARFNRRSFHKSRLNKMSIKCIKNPPAPASPPIRKQKPAHKPNPIAVLIAKIPDISNDDDDGFILI